MYDVIFYKDRLGNEPIKEYLYALKKKGLKSKNDRILAEKILAHIKALQDYGTRVGAPIVKHIDGDIWELRPLNNRTSFSTGKTILLSCCIILLKKQIKLHGESLTKHGATFRIF